jgi:glycine betaine/proline transport system ATP-binding protein
LSVFAAIRHTQTKASVRGESMAKLEVRNLTKVFGASPTKVLEMVKNGIEKDELLEKTSHTVGVNNVSFDVEEGETFVIMGLSGSGKSTLVRCINRLIEPDAGEISVDGLPVTGCSREELLHIRRHKIGMVFQNFALLPHRNITENVAFGLEIQGIGEDERRKKALEVLELVGLQGYAESMPSQLSGGMKQRVGLARALATDPDILLMDEAFSALDPLIRKEMQDELIALQGTMQKTIVFITHDLDEALKMGDRIAIMRDGGLVQIGTPEEILINPADDYVREFVQGVNRARVITAATIMKPAEPIVTARDGVGVAVRRMQQASLSSIFVIDRERRLKGIVTIDDAMGLLKTKRNELEIITNPDVVTVSPDARIEELLPMVIDSKYPIVVADDDRKVLGLIAKVSVLAGLLGEGENDE